MRRLWIIAFLLIGIVGAFLFDFTRFMNACRRYDERARLGPSQLTQPATDKEAIVVLTGDQDRIARAIELLRLRGSPILVISGTAKGATLTDLVNQQGGASKNIHEVWNKIILESESRSTSENAYQTGLILQKLGFQRVVLVTSDYHMYRAQRIFRRVLPGFEILEYPIASEACDWPFNLTEQAFSGFSKLWADYLKHVFFRIGLGRRVLKLEN